MLALQIHAHNISGTPRKINISYIWHSVEFQQNFSLGPYWAKHNAERSITSNTILLQFVSVSAMDYGQDSKKRWMHVNEKYGHS